MDFCAKLLKAECEVNQQVEGEEFQCYMILANDGGYVVLKRTAEDREDSCSLEVPIEIHYRQHCSCCTVM